MRFAKFLVVALLASSITGCACRARMADSTGDNIPTAADGGPLKDINFAFDSYALDSRAKAILQENASWLKANGGSRVQVEGHCDERGTNEYNMVLGANRARSAMEYLRGLGIEANRMSTVSYGEELPLDPAHNEGAWAKNRRAHFNVNK